MKFRKIKKAKSQRDILIEEGYLKFDTTPDGLVPSMFVRSEGIYGGAWVRVTDHARERMLDAMLSSGQYTPGKNSSPEEMQEVADLRLVNLFKASRIYERRNRLLQAIRHGDTALYAIHTSKPYVCVLTEHTEEEVQEGALPQIVTVYYKHRDSIRATYKMKEGV